MLRITHARVLTRTHSDTHCRAPESAVLSPWTVFPSQLEHSGSTWGRKNGTWRCSAPMVVTPSPQVPSKAAPTGRGRQETNPMKSWNKQHEKIPGTFNVCTGPRGRKSNPQESSQKGSCSFKAPTRTPVSFHTARAESREKCHLEGRMKVRRGSISKSQNEDKEFLSAKDGCRQALAHLRWATPACSSLSCGFHMTRKALHVKTYSKPGFAKERDFLPTTARRSTVPQEGLPGTSGASGMGPLVPGPAVEGPCGHT